MLISYTQSTLNVEGERNSPCVTYDAPPSGPVGGGNAGVGGGLRQPIAGTTTLTAPTVASAGSSVAFAVFAGTVPAAHAAAVPATARAAAFALLERWSRLHDAPHQTPGTGGVRRRRGRGTAVHSQSRHGDRSPPL